MNHPFQECVVPWQPVWEAVQLNQDGADAILPIHSMGEDSADLQKRYGNS